METAREFIVEMSMEMKTGSLKNLVGYLRQFQQFLLENNIAGPDCSLLFSSKIRRTYPISGYVHDDELEKIQKTTDEAVKSIDDIIKAKDAEIMEV